MSLDDVLNFNIRSLKGTKIYISNRLCMEKKTFPETPSSYYRRKELEAFIENRTRTHNNANNRIEQ